MNTTISSKQTRSSNVRKEIKTLVTFRTLFAYVSLESIRTHELYCFLLFRTVYYECYPMFSTSRTEFSFGLLCIAMDCSFLKINAFKERMSLRFEQNWKWSSKTFPHTLCAVKPWYETTCCGICLVSDANLH